MKHTIITCLLISVTLLIQAQSKSDPMSKMKQYYFVMLVKGNNRNQDSTAVEKIQEGHLANINRMIKEGICIQAGPFGDDGFWRGILVLDVKTEEEVRMQVEQDPAVKAGRLAYEIHPLWQQKGTITFK